MKTPNHNRMPPPPQQVRIDLGQMVGGKIVPQLTLEMFRTLFPPDQRAMVLQNVAGGVRAAINAEIEQMRKTPELQGAVIDGSLGRLHKQAEQMLRAMINDIAEQQVFPPPGDNGEDVKPKIVEP